MKIINGKEVAKDKITKQVIPYLRKIGERVPMEPLKRIVDMATIRYWGRSHE